MNFVTLNADDKKSGQYENLDYKYVKRFGMFDIIMLQITTHLSSLLWAQFILLPIIKKVKSNTWIVCFLGLLMMSGGIYTLSLLERD